MKPHQTSAIPGRKLLRKLTAAAGFSLIEITLALAIAAVGMIAILGLLPQGIQASRDAADSTMAATIVQDMFSQARALPFTQAGNFFTQKVNLSTQTTGQEEYFDQDGFLTLGLVKGKSYYKIRIDYDPQGSLPATTTKITARVIWRINPQTGVGGQNTNTFVTQISYYDVP